MLARAAILADSANKRCSSIDMPARVLLQQGVKYFIYSLFISFQWPFLTRRQLRCFQDQRIYVFHKLGLYRPNMFSAYRYSTAVRVSIRIRCMPGYRYCRCNSLDPSSRVEALGLSYKSTDIGETNVFPCTLKSVATVYVNPVLYVRFLYRYYVKLLYVCAYKIK